MVDMLDSQESSPLVYSLCDSKMVLCRNRSAMPWDWDFNSYRGCQFRCVYCSSRELQHHHLPGMPPLVKPLQEILGKTHGPEVLRRTLSGPSWRGDLINFGESADCFQPVESQLGLTHQALEVIDCYPTPISITTKSDLILNSLDLLGSIAKKVPVQINVSISSMDSRVGSLVEPFAPTAEKRFRVLERCKRVGCKTNLFLVPVIPFLTDNGKNIDRLLRRAAKIGVDGVFAWTLELPPGVLECYSAFLEENFPLWLKPTIDLYGNSKKMAVYRRNLFALIVGLMRKHDLAFPELNVKGGGVSHHNEEQLSLFN